MAQWLVKPQWLELTRSLGRQSWSRVINPAAAASIFCQFTFPATEHQRVINNTPFLFSKAKFTLCNSVLLQLIITKLGVTDNVHKQYGLS